MIYIDPFLLYIRAFIAAVGVAVITVGALRSLYQLFRLVVYEDITSNTIRLEFGNSVILGLEFMVGADIVGSLVEPDYYNLGLLAIIVLIRTVLSYFLNAELEALSPRQRKALH
ncbi:MAG: DUF1622 domain-containing protein [Candidatus Babeliales bacterium]